MKQNIILNLAISLDGYIADSDGGFAWIVGDGDTTHNSEKKFDFEKFLASIDVIVMGKQAFLDCPQETLESFKEKTVYVASHESIETPYKNITFIKGDIVDQITKMQKTIWLFGGAGLTDPFIKSDVIDEYIIGIIPTILGKGKLLFLENNPTLQLHLEEYTSQEGIVVLKYTRKK